jgi:hypothetical protein
MSSTKQSRPAWPFFVVLAGLYLLVVLLTRARFLGDTVDYTIEVHQFNRHAWDFGHLWWVPLGWLLTHAILLLSSASGSADIGTTSLLVFLGLNILAGLACVLLLAASLRRLGVGPLLAGAVSLVMLFSQAFLNYTQTGSSYIPGLALVLLSLYLALTRSPSSWIPLAAGAALGAAICFWFPYVLIVPAVLAVPLLLADDRPRVSFLFRMVLGLGLVVGLGYGAALVCLGISDPAGVRAWMARSSHGVATRGLARAVFGLARSFVTMGDDGVLFKRFLLHDPYNPVSFADLLRFSLWKFVLFYLALASLLVGLPWTPRGRRVLALLLCAAVPVVAFGIFWQGGDMERYLPLYPFFFLALAVLASEPSARMFAWLPAVFFVSVVVVNGLVLSRWEVDAYRDALKGRVLGLREELTPHSIVLVARDRLVLLPRDFPVDPDSQGLPFVEVATPGLQHRTSLRQEIAELVEQTWNAGGDVWFSRRLLADRPRPDSTWAEGDDPRLQWREVASLFGQLHTDRAVGGDDGFVRLTPSPHNRAVLGLPAEK